jgi:hypothetical protein
VKPGVPARVSRAASPVLRAPAPSSSPLPVATKTCTCGGLGDGHGLAGGEAAAPQHGAALVDADGALVALPAGQRHQPAGGERIVEVELLVAGGDAGRVGQHPHLQEVHRLVRAGVELAVANAGAGAHPLREAGVQHAVVAFAVAVFEPSRRAPR